ncbi:aldolase/citrate lyase family protein [Opitutus sp. ER46]|uniref:HpcH/HpaI aldolase family protein n=1 Tax=Opitutus sp. ER46 TaxID=2161864 RepID=UPI000D325B0F|nr:aldolase/citrate lyase family protein [Opitutus sp. ER46]PTX96436.1 2-dehydro-3-deoxyglucarate aldolase [Opitutus sp. ER46]
MKLPSDFRQRVLAREWLCGTFLNLGSPVTTEIAGLAGFDWVLIDHEHGPGGEDTLLHQLHAIGSTPAFPVVRVAANEAPRFKRVLDQGAFGVMVPYVNSAAEAQAAVNAMRYPPRGIRGVAKFNRGAAYGNDFDEYFAHAHERILAVIQIETPAAVAAVDDIAAVDGADVVFVGPTDLSYNMGIPNQLQSDAFKDAMRRVCAAARRHGKAAGILVHSPELVPMCRELGYTFVALGSDGGGVRAALLSYAAALRQGAPGPAGR